MLAGPALATPPLAWGSEDHAPPVDPGPTTLRAAVRRLLRDDAAVFAAVGERIRYAGSKQRDASPRITYLIPSLLRGADLDGYNGTNEARVRVSVWSADSIEVERLAEAAIRALEDFRGWVGTVYIDSISHLMSVDLPEFEGAGREASIYQIAIDFTVDHRA